MTFAEELRETTDEVIKYRIGTTNLQILNEMKELALNGLCSARYSKTELSDEFIHYLVKEGFKLYGRRDENSDWFHFYPVDSVPKYNEIMIKW